MQMKATVEIESYIDANGVNRLVCTTSSAIGYDINNALELYASFQKMKPIIDPSNQLMHELNNKIDGMSKFFRSSNAELGELGEQFVYNILSELTALYEDSYVERVNHVSNSCDIYLEYMSLKCGVEIKNHTSPIGVQQVNRFLEVDIANDSYNCGLFVSLKSGFAATTKVSHFKILYSHGKPCIFIADCIVNKHAVAIAVKMLNHLVSSSREIDQDKEMMISKITKMLQQVDRMNKHNNTAMKALKESNLIIDEIKKEIDDILNPEVKRGKHTCHLCDYSSDKKVDLNRHLKKEH